MTRTIEGNFWCCAAVQRPQEILFQGPITGRAALLMAGAMFYGSFSPLLSRSKRAAKADADEWNARSVTLPDLRVAPRRIRVVIDIDAGKRKEAKNANIKA